ncbi:N-acetyltransferase [Cryobacterium adonitolivorans]|uniref:N-acetyltransferase n=1 Tax=Cryobacterium adonitolivorans TaxID=1259189 RepID=A0A4R8VYU1_9MICO|nr:N-acetyltransferase [Cryobacterium adonitolivorans]
MNCRSYALGRTTARPRLAPLAVADVADVHAIYADPATWLHLPAGRHTALAQAERVVDESEQSWAAPGLGRWAIRLRHDLPGTALAAGTVIGVASAMLMDCGARNFGYRLTPASWAIGLATEAASAGTGSGLLAELGDLLPVLLCRELAAGVPLVEDAPGVARTRAHRA